MPLFLFSETLPSTMQVEYPTVDGALSQVCYYRALEDCYGRFCDKIDKLDGVTENASKGKNFDAESADYFVFHAPYNKLVQKSYGRMYLMDARRQHDRKLNRRDPEEKKAEEDDNATTPQIMETSAGIAEEYLTKPIEETYSDKSLEGTLKTISKASYAKRLTDSNAASKIVGNTYTASVFFGIASLIDRAGGRGDLKPGKSVVVFSYGSGALATMYRLHVRQPSSSSSSFTIEEMAKKLNLAARLASREEVHPSELDLALETRARMHRGGAPYSPVYPTVGRMFPGKFVCIFVAWSYYLLVLFYSSHLFGLFSHIFIIHSFQFCLCNL